NGSASLQIQVDDQGNTGGAAETDDDTISITVNAVNDAPVLANNGTLTAINEDVASGDNAGTLVSGLITGDVTDPDNATVGVAIFAAVTTNGTWQYALDGSTWTAFPGDLATDNVLLLTADGDTRIRFLPSANYNGDSGDISYYAWDTSDAASEG